MTPKFNFLVENLKYKFNVGDSVICIGKYSKYSTPLPHDKVCKITDLDTDEIRIEWDDSGPVGAYLRGAWVTPKDIVRVNPNFKHIKNIDKLIDI